ncbi:hypothetical protein [Halorientalis halophila]|uniref:hypothetical protein n=1 Tax=Halorientalis halophila TaxID=3108499 RepID=UPI00300B4B34
MTDGGEYAADRRTRIATAILAHRKAGSESPVRFAAADADAPAVEYRDREITVWVDEAERERLDALLGEFHVFKVAQPATRKAPDGEVHLSALADPKHAADFVDRLFLSVFEFPDGYDLRVEE